MHPQTEDYWGNVNCIGLRSCYDEGKRCAETLFFDYHRQHRLNIRVVRIFNTYGPRMHPNDGRVVSNFIMQALTGRDITVFGDGQQTRSFCFVDDLIEGIFRMMNHPGGFVGPVNLGNPNEFTIRELAERVIRLTGSRSRIVFNPLPADDPTQRRPTSRWRSASSAGSRRSSSRRVCAAPSRISRSLQPSRPPEPRPPGSRRRAALRTGHYLFTVPRKEATPMSTRKPIVRLMALALSLLLLSACAMFEKGPAKPEPQRLPDQREFDDVLVPRDMDIDREASAIYRRDGASIGILRMSGRIDAELAHAVLSEQPRQRGLAPGFRDAGPAVAHGLPEGQPHGRDRPVRRQPDDLRGHLGRPDERDLRRHPAEEVTRAGSEGAWSTAAHSSS